MNETAIRKRFCAEVKKAGGVNAFAASHKLKPSYISDMKNGRRGFSERVLKILGLKIDYVEID
jgi:hypothetical protein